MLAHRSIDMLHTVPMTTTSQSCWEDAVRCGVTQSAENSPLCPLLHTAHSSSGTRTGTWLSRVPVLCTPSRAVSRWVLSSAEGRPVAPDMCPSLPALSSSIFPNPSSCGSTRGRLTPADDASGLTPPLPVFPPPLQPDLVGRVVPFTMVSPAQKHSIAPHCLWWEGSDWSRWHRASDSHYFPSP